LKVQVDHAGTNSNGDIAPFTEPCSLARMARRVFGQAPSCHAWGLFPWCPKTTRECNSPLYIKMDTESQGTPEIKRGAADHQMTAVNAAWILAIVVCLALLLIGLHFITSGLAAGWNKTRLPRMRGRPGRRGFKSPNCRRTFHVCRFRAWSCWIWPSATTWLEVGSGRLDEVTSRPVADPVTHRPPFELSNQKW